MSKQLKRQRTDKEKLELFVVKVNELSQTRLAKNEFKNRYSYRVQNGQPLESKLDQPDEADLRDYLLTFRQFIAEKEDIHLNRILNICTKLLIDDDMRKYIAKARESLKKVGLDNSFQLIIFGARYTPLQITDIYLNSKYFHNDVEGQEFLDSIPKFASDLLRARFLHFIQFTSLIIIDINNIIKYSFEENLFQFE